MKYSVLATPDKESNMHPIQIDEGDFAGCQLIYGACTITDDGQLKFDYEIVNDYTVSKDKMEDFVKTIGDILVEMIQEFLAKEEVVYKGGV